MQAGAGLSTPKQRPTAAKVLDNAMLADVFGIEMADSAPMTKPTARRGKATESKPTVATTGKAPAAKSPKVVSKTRTQKIAVTQAPVPTSEARRKSVAVNVMADKAIEAVRTRQKGKGKTKNRVSE